MQHSGTVHALDLKIPGSNPVELKARISEDLQIHEFRFLSRVLRYYAILFPFNLATLFQRESAKKNAALETSVHCMYQSKTESHLNNLSLFHVPVDQLN